MIKCELCKKQAWSQPLGAMWRHESNGCALASSVVLGESDVAAINAAIEAAKGGGRKGEDVADLEWGRKHRTKEGLVELYRNDPIVNALVTILTIEARADQNKKMVEDAELGRLVRKMERGNILIRRAGHVGDEAWSVTSAEDANAPTYYGETPEEALKESKG